MMTLKHNEENAEDEIREAFKVFDGVNHRFSVYKHSYPISEVCSSVN